MRPRVKDSVWLLEALCFVQFLAVQNKKGRTCQEWEVADDGHEVSFWGHKTLLGLVVAVAQPVSVLNTTELCTLKW